MNRYSLYDTATGRIFYAYSPNPTRAAWKVRKANLGGQLIIEDAGRYDSAKNVIVDDHTPSILVRGGAR